MSKLSEIDVKDTLYSLLVNAGIEEEISGKVYKDQRPMNSPYEDAEITVLASSVTQNQEFVANVNVFVHDVLRSDEMIEDTPRLRSLSQAFMGVLEYNQFGSFIIALESQRIEKLRDADLHVIINRLDIKYNSEIR